MMFYLISIYFGLKQAFLNIFIEIVPALIVLTIILFPSNTKFTYNRDSFSFKNQQYTFEDIVDIHYRSYSTPNSQDNKQLF
jgi:hypothetical protein